MKFICNRIRR